MRRDHFVPVAYLKNFTDKDGKLHQFTKKYWHHGYIFPEQTCWRDHGNEVPKDLLDRFGLNDPMVVERQAFKQYEDSVKEISDIFLAGAPVLSYKLFIILCQGYILHKQRTPYYQKGLARVMEERGHEFLDKVAQQQREEMTAEIRAMPNYEQIKGHPNIIAYLSDEYWNNLRKTMGEQKHDTRHTQMVGLLTTAMGRNEETVKMLGKLSMMELKILNAAKDHNFFSSDNPGFATGVDLSQTKGLSTSNTNFNDCFAVTLPFNSKQAVYITYGNSSIIDPIDRQIQYIDLSVDDTISLNHGTMFWSDEKVMCCDREDIMRYRPTS